MPIAELKKYELIVIVDPSSNEEAASKLQTQIKEVVTRHGGQVSETVPLGRRKLSYKIGKFAEGNYLQINFQAPASEIIGLKKALGLMESIIRFMVVQETVPLRNIRQVTEGGDSQKAEARDLEVSE